MQVLERRLSPKSPDHKINGGLGSERYHGTLSQRSPEIRRYFREFPRLEGFLDPIDAMLLMLVDETLRTAPNLGKSKVAEIGVYKGKSAIALGYGAKGEDLVVCDIFGDTEGLSAANREEYEVSPYEFNRETFERNYLAFHPSLPVIRDTPSATAFGEADRGRYRLVHIDGSHVYEDVSNDLSIVEGMLVPGGVAVLDDFNSATTLGVQQAFWNEYSKGQMRLVFNTLRKAYVTWDEGRCPITLDVLRGWTEQDEDIRIKLKPGLAGGRRTPFIYERGTAVWVDQDTEIPPLGRES